MASGSIRLNTARDIHQHDEPQPGAERAALPDSRREDCCADPGPAAGRLWRENGRVLYQDASGGEPQAVRVLWARPLSGRGGPVSVMLAGKKKEVAYYASPDELPEDSRRVALEELEAGMVMPRIAVIHRIKSRFGNYYWDVETDLGRRRFLLSSPENNSYRPRPDAIVVKDVSGSCYEIPSVSGLSVGSRRELNRVL